MQNTTHSILRRALALAAVATFVVCAPLSHAKQGKDDPVAQKAVDDKGGTLKSGTKGRGGIDDSASTNGTAVVAPRPSGDDPLDHDSDELRRARGADDPADHDAGDDRVRGTDDPLNHDVGDDKGGAAKSGGKGRGGKDDLPPHG